MSTDGEAFTSELTDLIARQIDSWPEWTPQWEGELEVTPGCVAIHTEERGWLVRDMADLSWRVPTMCEVRRIAAHLLSQPSAAAALFTETIHEH